MASRKTRTPRIKKATPAPPKPVVQVVCEPVIMWVAKSASMPDVFRSGPHASPELAAESLQAQISECFYDGPDAPPAKAKIVIQQDMELVTHSIVLQLIETLMTRYNVSEPTIRFIIGYAMDLTYKVWNKKE